MQLTRRAPSDAELWRRLVRWSRASDSMLAGCGIGCMMAVMVCAIALARDAEATYVVAGAAALGVALEGVRRLCEAFRTRALDAAAPALLASRGLSREAISLAVLTLRSGRIEELDASLAFASDPFHCAIESALGVALAPRSPLCEQGESARAVVVGLGRGWAAVLRFTNDELREARVHQRQFAWNDGKGPRRIDLPIDAGERALLERSICALAQSSRDVDPTASSHLLPDGGLAIGIAVIDSAGQRRGAIGAVDLTREARTQVDGGRGGPYRAITRPAESTRAENVEVLIEGRPHPLAASPRDESAPNLFAHVIVLAAARVLQPLILVEQQTAIKGRPLRIDGAPIVASARRESQWIDPVPAIAEIDPARRARIAELWLRAALIEHASIFAFERLARVMSTLAPPTPLIDRMRSAMEDENRHARDAFSLAAAYSGEELGPAPLQIPDAAPPSIDALAIETFFDGCVGETLAARQASVALARCRVPAARAAIERVAIDERRHAELAWEMLAWLWPRASASARSRISEASPPSSRIAPDRRDGDWLAYHGWLTSAEERAIEIAAWLDEIGPRRDALPRVRHFEPPFCCI